MIAQSLACILLVLGVAFGLARPVADRLGLRPIESLAAGAGLSLVAAWAIAFAVFASGAPLAAYWAIPVLAAVGLAVGRRGAAAILADGAARDLAAGQLLASGWCVAWLSFVRVHSGGAWIGDSFEHWERALYFLRAWPGGVFIGQYILPARPPLANNLVAAFMQMTGTGYANFQVATAALCSLAFLPAGLLAWRFGGRAAVRLCAVAFLVSPLFVQNATYPWTKLEAAFFVLSGIYFFARLRDGGPAAAASGILCAALLGGAVVAHYSAGPYVVVLAAAWVAMGFRRGWDRPFVALTAAAIGAGALVLAPWFAWSIAKFGAAATFTSNTTVDMAAKHPGNPLVTMALNIRDTLVPPQVRGFKGGLFRQQSSWGSLRDNCFLLYQLNPVLALGSAGCLVAAAGAWREARAARAADRLFWGSLILGAFVISFAAYGDRDHYGIGHICLQPLVLLGLAFIASRWERLSLGWRVLLVTGWCADFILGIALQFAVEDYALDRWLTPGRSLVDVYRSYTLASQENLREKIIAHVSFFADNLTIRPALVLILLGAILVLAVARSGRTPDGAGPP
ncbi:MAG TPA: hypothetical protein VGG37_08050 [Opitutaceae bacterium]|jgi:hypothetical protein